MRVEEESAEAIVAKKRGKPRGAKGRRTTKQALPKALRGITRSTPKRTDVATAAAFRAGGEAERRWIPTRRATVGYEDSFERLRE